jgi:hypothetical protein
MNRAEQKQAIYDAISRHGEHGISLTELTQHVGKRKRINIDAHNRGLMLMSLLKEGKIKMDAGEPVPRGRPATIYTVVKP